MGLGIQRKLFQHFQKPFESIHLLTSSPYILCHHTPTGKMPVPRSLLGCPALAPRPLDPAVLPTSATHRLPLSDPQLLVRLIQGCPAGGQLPLLCQVASNTNLQW